MVVGALHISLIKVEQVPFGRLRIINQVRREHEDDEVESMKPGVQPLRTVPAFVTAAEEMFTHPELGVFHPL